MNSHKLFLAALLTILTLPTAAHAVLIVSNLTGPNIGNVAASDFWPAQAFETDSRNYTLDQVRLGGFITTAFVGDWSIYEGASAPGTKIGDLTNPTFDSSTGINITTFTPMGNIALSASTRFWMAVEPSSGGFAWTFADGASTGAGTLPPLIAFSPDQGASWTALIGTRRIEVSGTVPEPGVTLLLLAGAMASLSAGPLRTRSPRRPRV